jgi:hypothetical protein
MMVQYRWLFPRLRGQVATLEAYLSEVDRMLSTLAARAPSCKAAVLSLPPIGEDLGDAVNGAVRRYNAALAELVARHAPRARLVDFHGACQRRLEAARREGAARPPPFALMSFGGFLRTQVGVGGGCVSAPKRALRALQEHAQGCAPQVAGVQGPTTLCLQKAVRRSGRAAANNKRLR